MTVPINRQDHALAPHVALVIVQILFGTWPIFGKLVLRSISSSGLVAFRIMGAAAAFLIVQRNLSALRRMPFKDFALLVLCCVLGVVANQLLFVKGLSLTTVINATLLTTTIPAFTVLISIFLGYERASLRRLAGIALAGAGVIYLVDPFRATFSSQTTVGNVLIICNSLAYAGYIAISKDLFKRYGALNVITWIFLVGAVITLPFGLRAARSGELQIAGTTVWLCILYIIIFPTVGAYYLNAWALTRVAPSIVAVYIYLQPLIAFGLAPLILGETLNSRTIIACILIFAGVGIVIWRRRGVPVDELSEHPDALAH
jgi:drug/metabolite transporter (DMT)-like permease